MRTSGRSTGPALLLAAVLLTACRGGAEAPAPRLLYLLPAGSDEEIPPEVRDAVVARVEVAADDVARARGLMFRERLEPDHGMIFIYPSPRLLRFWMKNTRIPLSICFADESGRILSILEMEAGAGRPEHLLPFYESDEPGIYAVEMAKGWFRVRGIRPGDRLRLSPSLAAIQAR